MNESMINSNIEAINAVVEILHLIRNLPLESRLKIHSALTIFLDIEFSSTIFKILEAIANLPSELDSRVVVSTLLSLLNSDTDTKENDNE